jgi:hypothetical protein
MKREETLDFGQDSGIIKKDKFLTTSQKIDNIIKSQEPLEELKPNQYFKFYELNEEGLKLYGKYKKEQMLSVLKWSVLGTVIGYSFSVLIELYGKKINPNRIDIYKTGFLFMSVGFFTFQGLQKATMTFKKQQNYLTLKYGKEVREDYGREEISEFTNNINNYTNIDNNKKI